MKTELISLNTTYQNNKLETRKKSVEFDAILDDKSTDKSVNDSLINECLVNAKDDFAWSHYGYCCYFPTEWHTPRKYMETSIDYMSKIPKEDLGVMMFLESCGEIETRKVYPIKNDLDRKAYEKAVKVLNEYQITPDLELKIIEFAKKSSKEFMQKFDAPAGNIGLNHSKLQAIFKKHNISMSEFEDSKKLFKPKIEFDFMQEQLLKKSIEDKELFYKSNIQKALQTI